MEVIFFLLWKYRVLFRKLEVLCFYKYENCILFICNWLWVKICRDESVLFEIRKRFDILVSKILNFCSC